LFSCNLLNQSTYSNWESVFDGLHILLGFDTYGAIAPDQGSQFVNRMTGTGTYDETQIRGAWRETLKHTIDDASINGAYMWADPSGNDYLPGFGQYYKPVKDGSGHYAIQWEYFDCKS
ncbi:MAG: hypothetical protein JW931_09730, partial [Methanomicrobiaceae archaeon]|nr:hypothetical protein [Methanomicrobiaceae archaeon]